jgi:uncharacterized protein
LNFDFLGFSQKIIAAAWKSKLLTKNQGAEKFLFSDYNNWIENYDSKQDGMLTMTIPTRSRCLALMVQMQMPEHIQKHSIAVARIAVLLGRHLNQNSVRLDLELLEAGALLHDIAKAQTLSTSQRHEDVGARMLESWGYPMLSPIVKDHVKLETSTLAGPITESLVVNYSDKRVKHDQIVTLEDRFSDLVGRYAKTGEHRSWLQAKFELYQLLESKLFEHLTITPKDLAHLCFSQSEPTP